VTLRECASATQVTFPPASALDRERGEAFTHSTVIMAQARGSRIGEARPGRAFVRIAASALMYLRKTRRCCSSSSSRIGLRKIPCILNLTNFDGHARSACVYVLLVFDKLVGFLLRWRRIHEITRLFDTILHLELQESGTADMYTNIFGIRQANNPTVVPHHLC